MANPEESIVEYSQEETIKPNEATKHYSEDWFDGLWGYEVQWENDETLYSIAIQLINRNLDNADKTFVRNLFIEKANEEWFFPSIKKGDVISIWMVDPVSFEIGVWDEFYVANISNNEIYRIPEEGMDIPSDDLIKYPDLTNEEIEQLVTAIKIKTEKAQIWLFAWERDVYTLVVWDFIEWPLPTTAEPIDLLVDIDPNKVISKTRDVLKGEDIDSITINDIIDSNNQTTVDADTEKEVLQLFKWFVASLYEWVEFKKYLSMTPLD